MFGLVCGFWIGNSHCALNRAPNTDSQKPINYSSRLDWQDPIIGWLLSFSQVPRSQSVQTKQVAAEETSSSSPWNWLTSSRKLPAYNYHIICVVNHTASCHGFVTCSTYNPPPPKKVWGKKSKHHFQKVVWWKVSSQIYLSSCENCS